MAAVLKNITDTKNIYTYFEFCGYDGWDEFDRLFSILTDEMWCSVQNKLDGIYSRHCVLEKGGLVFKLMYHEDVGNCLCSQDKKTDDYYEQLEKIAFEVAEKL